MDAKSVYAATIATFIKVPAEKSLLTHVQYIREQLDNHILNRLAWIDTRDMTADGLTKGAVSRDLIHEIMDGKLVLRHDMESWGSKVKSGAARISGSQGADVSAHDDEEKEENRRCDSTRHL